MMGMDLNSILLIMVLFSATGAALAVVELVHHTRPRSPSPFDEQREP